MNMPIVIAQIVYGLLWLTIQTKTTFLRFHLLG